MQVKQIILPLFFISCLFFSCKEKESSRQIVPLVLDSLEFYNPGTIKQPETKFNIVTYINTACPTCVSEIENWNEIYRSVKEKSCGVRLICYADDYFEYFKYQCQKGNIKSDIGYYLDTTGNFAVKNEILFKNNADKTCLVDNHNNVVLVGNPLHNKRTLGEYMKVLSL